jgi:SOS-response transcriptional repressor LexA
MTRTNQYQRLGSAVLGWIAAYIEAHGYSPSTREIANAHEVATSQAHELLRRMEREGLITQQPGIARTVRLTGAAMTDPQEGM